MTVMRGDRWSLEDPRTGNAIAAQDNNEELQRKPCSIGSSMTSVASFQRRSAVNNNLPRCQEHLTCSLFPFWIRRIHFQSITTNGADERRPRKVSARVGNMPVHLSERL